MKKTLKKNHNMAPLSNIQNAFFQSDGNGQLEVKKHKQCSGKVILLCEKYEYISNDQYWCIGTSAKYQ